MTGFRVVRLAAFLLGMLLAAPAAASSLVSEETFVGEITRLSRDDRWLTNLAILNFDATSPAYTHYKATMQDLLGRPEVVRYLYRGIKGNAAAARDLRTMGQVVGEQMVSGGLRRLPHRDLREFARLVSVLLEAAPDGLCARMLRDQLSPADRMRLTGIIGNLDAPSSQGYFRLVRAAVLAEANNQPAITRLSPSQKEQADEALGQVLMSQLGEGPPLERFMQAAANQAEAADADLCWVARQTLRAVHGVEGKSQYWLLVDLFGEG